MKGILTMSHKELDRAKILAQFIERKMTVEKAAEILSITERHLYRILKRYRKEGDLGLIHRLRGRPSNNGYDEALKKKVVRLYRSQYPDFGPTFFTEMLLSGHDIEVDHETVRRWLNKAGGTNVQRKKRPHRKQRPRRSAVGELIQFDGSDHDWFEGRGPRCCLLETIDDASGRVFMRFAPSENATDIMKFFHAYCERFGIPRTIYTDRGTALWSEKTLTDNARALKSLGVDIVYAKSPQAKGRVERVHRTHQDRLVKLLRLKGISTIAEANQFLEKKYIDQHNAKFSNTDALPDVHRPLPSEIDLHNIFCFQTTRQVRNDYTITLNGQYIQLLKGEYALPHPHQHVCVRFYLDHSLHIFSNEDQIQFEHLQQKPQPKQRVPSIPPPTHPWRSNFIGKGRFIKKSRSIHFTNISTSRDGKKRVQTI